MGEVTGDEATVINGLIQVTGENFHLFLMNLSGIVFGSNASLNVPGSFTVTTATGISFGNNNWFIDTKAGNIIYNSASGSGGAIAVDAATNITVQRINATGGGGTGGAITTGVTFFDPVTIQSPSEGGTITANGAIAGLDNASIYLTAFGDIIAKNITAASGITLFKHPRSN